MKILLGLLIALFVAGCGSSEAPTRIAVRIETNMTQGSKELTSVDVELFHEGTDTPFFRRNFDLTGTVELPGDVLVTAQDPTDTRRLVVIARANVVGGTSFTQRALTSFARGRLLYLQMFLARRCISTRCLTGMSCGRNGCEPDARDATPTLVPRDGSVTELDVPADGAEAAVDAPLSEASVDATIDAPADVVTDTTLPDAAPDVFVDAAPDVFVDAAPDVFVDAAPDVFVDAPGELPADVSGDLATDAPTDVAVDIVDAGPPCPTGMARCGGTCIGVVTDTNNCGACGNVCPASTMGGTVDCFMGMCRARCVEGLHGCGGTCVSNTSVDSCGTRCDPCPLPPNASVRACSSMGLCTFTCNPGFTVSMDTCAPAPPRAIAPLSSATTTTRSPTLVWTAPAGIGALIEVCSSPTCASGADVHSAMVMTGSSYMIPFALDAGRYYWQMYGVADGARSLTPSPIWSFAVRARGSTVSSSWGSVPDLDGDGLADVLVGSSDNTVRLFRGVRGAAPVPGLPIDRPTGVTTFGLLTSSAGDFDGDGDVDFVVGNTRSTSGGGTVPVLAPMRNDRTSLTFLPRIEQPLPSRADQIGGVGDVNGDGYGDIATVTVGGASYYIYLGSATGPTTPAWFTRSYGSAADPRFAACDFNGDHVGDFALLATTALRVEVFLGQTGTVPMPVAPFTSEGVTGVASGDFDGDGYCDLVASSDRAGIQVHFGGSMPFGPRAQTVSRAHDFLASAGDMNGDGYDDLVLAHLLSDTYSVYLGGSSGLQTTIPTSSTFGVGTLFTVFGVTGDVDGDGMLDFGYINDRVTPAQMVIRPWSSTGWAPAYMTTAVLGRSISSR